MTINCIPNTCQTDGTGVVHQYIETSKLFDSLLEGTLNRLFIPEVALNGQTFATNRFNCFITTDINDCIINDMITNLPQQRYR